MSTLHESPEDLIALSLVTGAGRKVLHAARRLALRQGRALSSLFSMPLGELLLLAAPGESDAAEALSRCGNQEQFRATWMMDAARDQSVRVVLSNTPGYPGFLGERLGDQAPLFLFFLGNEALLESPGAGIVGTRHPSGEGTEVAVAAARLFAEEGIPVVSGGASGIDQAAHRAALEADGSTIAIVPEGLRSYEPPDFLRTGMARGQVLLVSEYLPTDGWHTHRAMTRNRTIAACSHVVCVIEPREKSGSMYTVEQTLALGQPVFYWGAVCRDGALARQPNTCALLESGRIVRDRLLDAADGKPSPAAKQSDLFND